MAMTQVIDHSDYEQTLTDANVRAHLRGDCPRLHKFNARTKHLVIGALSDGTKVVLSVTPGESPRKVGQVYSETF